MCRAVELLPQYVIAVPELVQQSLPAHTARPDRQGAVQTADTSSLDARSIVMQKATLLVDTNSFELTGHSDVVAYLEAKETLLHLAFSRLGLRKASRRFLNTP